MTLEDELVDIPAPDGPMRPCLFRPAAACFYATDIHTRSLGGA